MFEHALVQPTQAITSTVPTASQGVKGSPSSAMPMTMVDSGPIMPTCAAMLAPTRSTPNITSSTGTAVHSVALSSDSHSTGGATWAAASGLTSRNCAMQQALATVEARPTRRRLPMRCTSSPLKNRYSA